MPALGDNRPSQLMDKMLVLLGNHPPCFRFRGIFYQRMPDYVRAALVHSKIEDCRELAKAADVLWSAHQASANAVSKPHTSGTADSSRSFSDPRFCWYHSKFGDKATKCNRPCFSGKRKSRSPVMASATDSTLNSLFFVSDQRTGRSFLVDSGAEVSVLPASSEDRRSASNAKSTSLSAANGSSIPTFGKRSVSFQLSGTKYEWSFILANVQRPIPVSYTHLTLPTTPYV